MNVNSELAKTRKRNSTGKFLPIHGLSKTRKYKRQTRQKWEKSLSNEKKEKLKEQCKKSRKKGYKNISEQRKKEINERRNKWRRQLMSSPENRKKVNEQRKEYRHKIGISKNYGSGKSSGGGRPISSKLTEQEKKERKRLHNIKYKNNKRGAGKLTIKVIQLVYEDNIKQFGTLTCYLCKKPIDMQLKFFGKIMSEHLEHKIPLSKGGTNDYENLGIACNRCNCRKHDKTIAEYFKYLNKKGVKK